ncbi:ryncolin-4-like [Drosophila innubila]|uniref:ryncolin-4-like n=1 Tax=Drosophila innubila TaxID=198719 RepID=UPI00148DCB63|nr:ryncolin-4-like [Drosophila innubila]
MEHLGETLDGVLKGLDKPHCTDANSSGIYDIVISNFSDEPFKVACDAETQGGGWTIILRRMDGSENFYRNWTEYKNGFGDLGGEFFLGLEKIHALTNEREQELLVVVEDFKGIEAFERYDDFAIGNEDQKYKLHTLGKASGTAGDSLRRQEGQKFSTYDQDNDIHDESCAKKFTGAWWYQKCHNSHLAGKYNDNSFGIGVNWDAFRGPRYSLKKAMMMIRPKK